MATKSQFYAMALGVLMSSAAWAEENLTVEPANLAVRTFHFDPQNLSVPWIRPPEVQFVLISGCGGGGGGGAVVTTGSGSASNSTPGKGGGAASMYTILIPVKANRYDIVIGDGGGAAANGASTTMTAAGESPITLWGGLQGASASTDGAPSAFGIGGKYSTSPEEADGKSVCSGGGAAAPFSMRAGGKGAPGWLTIMPVPDIGRFGRVMAMVEDLSRPSELPDDANSKPGEPGQGTAADSDTTGAVR